MANSRNLVTTKMIQQQSLVVTLGNYLSPLCQCLISLTASKKKKSKIKTLGAIRQVLFLLLEGNQKKVLRKICGEEKITSEK